MRSLAWLSFSSSRLRDILECPGDDSKVWDWNPTDDTVNDQTDDRGKPDYEDKFCLGNELTVNDMQAALQKLVGKGMLLENERRGLLARLRRAKDDSTGRWVGSKGASLVVYSF